jgi:hypothetical protein
MSENEAKGVVDPRLNSFLYNFNTLINYAEATGRDFEADDLKILSAYFEDVRAEVEKNGTEFTLPKNNIQVIKILRALTYAGLKDEFPGLRLADVGKMLSAKTLSAGALEVILTGIRKGTVSDPN